MIHTHTTTRTDINTAFNFLSGYEKVCVNNAWWDRERNRESRTTQADQADWQFDLICTNRGLDEDGRGEEMGGWEAATVCFSDISAPPHHPNKVQKAFGFSACCLCVCACVCGADSVWVRTCLCVCQLGEDCVFNQLIRVHFAPKSN